MKKLMALALFFSLPSFAVEPSIHFVLGGGMTDKQWSDLAAFAQTYYNNHGIPGKFNFYKFTDNVALEISKVPCAVPVILIGHSFGGSQAIENAKRATRNIDYLILFDPVVDTLTDPKGYSVPNTKGFALPGNVVQAIDFYREACEAPYSGKISSGTKFKNIVMPTTAEKSDACKASQHGYAVWSSVALSYIKKAILGQAL